MDRFRELETFVAVAEHGGFNAAARQLHMSPPSVTRLVASLEERLGTSLFIRTTRHVALTEAGERLLHDATRILSDLEAMEASAAGAHLEPQGVLSVTAPVKFGHMFVAPIVRDYVDTYPTVSAHTLFVDRVVNLVEEGLDVAVRIGELPDSSLKATRVGFLRRVLVAAPAYLKKASPLQHPGDVAQHRIVLPSGLDPNPVWEFVVKGKRDTIHLQPSLTCNTVDAAVDAARAGWGLTRALSYQVAEPLARGELVELLAGFEDRKLPIHLVHSEGRLAAAKIRTFVDFAADVLRGHAQWLEAV